MFGITYCCVKNCVLNMLFLIPPSITRSNATRPIICNLVKCILTCFSWLISKDRREEAFAILVKYHAEGDADSIFARAEVAQIETVIILERDASKQSWRDMISTPGMRRRTLIASAMGIFTQWSGNTLISYVFPIHGCHQKFAR